MTNKSGSKSQPSSPSSSTASKKQSFRRAPSKKKIPTVTYTVEGLQEKIVHLKIKYEALKEEKAIVDDLEQNFVPLLLQNGDRQSIDTLSKIRHDRERMERSTPQNAYIEGMEENMTTVEELLKVHSILQEKIVQLTTEIGTINDTISSVHQNFGHDVVDVAVYE